MKTCPRCRSEYPDDALFCAECGASLAETPTASATPAATLSEAAPSSAPLDETPAPAETPSALLSEPPFLPVEQPASAAPSQAIYGNPPALPILIENNTPFTKQTLKDFYKNLKILSFLSFIFAAISFSVYYFGPPFLRTTVILGMASIFVVCGILFVFFVERLCQKKYFDYRFHLCSLSMRRTVYPLLQFRRRKKGRRNAYRIRKNISGVSKQKIYHDSYRRGSSHYPPYKPRNLYNRNGGRIQRSAPREMRAENRAFSEKIA